MFQIEIVICLWLKGYLQWQRFLAKGPVTLTRKSQQCTCLGHLGQLGTNRNSPLHVCRVAQYGQSKNRADFCTSLSPAILKKKTLLM
jgi:hypothetical protein